MVLFRFSATGGSSRPRPAATCKHLAADVAEVDLRLRALFEKHPVDFPVPLDRLDPATFRYTLTAKPVTAA